VLAYPELCVAMVAVVCALAPVLERHRSDG